MDAVCLWHRRLVMGRKLACCIVVIASAVCAQEKTVPPRPADIPVHWRAIIGEYIAADDTFVVREVKGKLEFGGSKREFTIVRARPDGRLSAGATKGTPEQFLAFSGASGEPNGLLFEGRLIPKRRLGKGGESFRIVPLHPAAELRKRARAATPPKETGNFAASDLVELTELDTTIRLDIRYASRNNFMGEKFYASSCAFLQRPAAEGLLNAHRWLNQFGYGILVHDCYRPWYVTKMFWDATPNDKKSFVADPAKGSRHNRGCAADISLYEIATGAPVEMTSGYDEMTERASPAFSGGTSLQRWHRDLLRTAMERNGFIVYDGEWWHFDYHDWRRYRIGTKTFEELSR